MKKQRLKKLLSLLAAGTAAFSMGLNVFAATADTAVIDTGKTASLNIYKYDMTRAAMDGVWDDSYISTGVYDKTGVNDVLGNPSRVNELGNGEQSYGYAIKGVEFTYLKVADITTFSKTVMQDGQPVNTVMNLYGFPEAGTGEKLLNDIGLSFNERYKDADKTVNGTQMYYFTSDALVAALDAALTRNATTVKNALESYVTGNGGTAMAETDGYGHTSADGLPLGLYLLVETRVPEMVTTTTNPFLVSLPMTSVDGNNATDGGTRWMYDVTVYPKNATGMPTLEKTVRESAADTGKNTGSAADITDGYAHTATASDGDVVEYQVISTLPAVTSAASYLTTYTYVDTLAKGLTYNRNDVVIECFTDEACTDRIAIWKQSDALQKFAVAYTSGTAAGTGAGVSTMTVSMTDAGLSEINTAKTVYTTDTAVESGYSQCTMRITYTATVNSDATVVYGDDGNPNEVVLTWQRTNMDYYDTLTDDCHVYTYGIDLTKQFSDAAGDFGAVKLLLHNDTDNYYVTASLIDGIYYVTGHPEAEADATVFVPTAAGKVIVKGLEDDTYTITEIETDNGYTLLKDNIEVVISTAETTDACPVCLHQLLTASATVNGDAVAMDADNSSVNALVPLTVVNTKGFDLPQTGSYGTWIFTVGGVLTMAISIAVIVIACKKSKDKLTDEAK